MRCSVDFYRTFLTVLWWKFITSYKSLSQRYFYHLLFWHYILWAMKKGYFSKKNKLLTYITLKLQRRISLKNCNWVDLHVMILMDVKRFLILLRPVFIPCFNSDEGCHNWCSETMVKNCWYHLIFASAPSG